MASDKSTGSARPLARSERLLIEAVGDESVVYDQDSGVAHALKPLAAAVFTYADGKNSTDEIAELAAYRLGITVTADDVIEAVAQLEAQSLMTFTDGDSSSFLEAGISRRTALKTLAAAGAGTVLLTSTSTAFAASTTTADRIDYGKPYMCGTGEAGITDSGSTYGTDPSVSSTGLSSWPQPYSSNYTDKSDAAFLSGVTAGAPVSTSGTIPNLGDSCYASVTAGTTTTTLTEITVSSTAATAIQSLLNAGNVGVSGSDIPSNTIVAGVSGTTVTLSKAATQALNNASLLFTGPTFTDVTASTVSGHDNELSVSSTTDADDIDDLWSSGVSVAVSGAHISSGTTVTNVSGRTVTLSKDASQTISNSSLTFTPAALSVTATSVSTTKTETIVYGTYQVVPCDGSVGSGYACAEAVCVPTVDGTENGTPLKITGTITSGPLLTGFDNSDNQTFTPGYAPYTETEYTGDGYPVKVCCPGQICSS